MAGKKTYYSIIFPIKPAALVIAILLISCLPAAAQTVHENPNTLTPSRGQGFDAQMNALLVKMLGSLGDVSSALNNNNITSARNAYARFSSSLDNFGELLWQLNLSESDYQNISGQMNLTNADIRAIIDGSDAYGRGMILYNASLSGGDQANASIAAAQVRDSYRNVSSSYGSLRRNVTVLESILSDRNVDVGSLDSSLGSLDQYVYRLNQSYSNLTISDNGYRIQLNADRGQTSVGGRVNFFGYLRDSNGDPVSNAGVGVYVDGKPAGTFVTDINGEGFLSYDVPVGVSGDHILAHAEYVPSSSSGPLVLSNYIELTLQDMPSTLSLLMDRDTASFGDTVNVTGELTSDGMVMRDRPVGIFLNGALLANVSTDRNGSYAYTFHIGPSMPAGNSLVNAVYLRGVNDILLNGSSQSRSLNIPARQTNLTINTSGAAVIGSPYGIYGSLTADNGVPVDGANVSILIDGSAAGSGITGDDGAYDVVIVLSNNSTAGNHTIFASYDPGPGKALAASSSAPLAVVFQAAGPPEDRMAMLFTGAAILLIAAIVAVFIWRRYHVPAPEKAVMIPEAPATPIITPVEPPLDVAAESDRIRSLGTKDSREAMAQVYILSRKVLSARVRLDESLTHHEFYDAAVAAVPSVSHPLKDIVGLYEKAIFANMPVTSAELERAVGGIKDLDNCIREAAR